ncbi:MAG: hypothetical protein ACM3TR_07640 [Caulobacteraceae bacterium]
MNPTLNTVHSMHSTHGSLNEHFKLPQKYCFPIVALILGYSENGGVVRGRLDGPGVVHYQEYHRLDETELEEQVKEYDMEDKNMGVVFFKSSKEQPYSRYLDWFYRIWSRPKPEFYEGRKVEIMQFLKKTGFIE